MTTATFRFHAELNDFLARDRRGRRFAHAFTGTPSVKDAVERLGVPHTEVGRIVLDGAPTGFGRLLRGGEELDVYPADPGAQPAGEPRFVADVHLGALARHLRLLGFDTAYGPDAGDAELAQISAAEDRILLTRDRRLLMRRVVVRGMFLRSDDPSEQLVEVARRWALPGRMRPFSRCMGCGAELVDVEKAAVLDRLEPGTRRTYEDFRRCPGCDRVFWRGAHSARLEAIVAGVENLTP